jgi:hypothetical protein
LKRAILLSVANACVPAATAAVEAASVLIKLLRDESDFFFIGEI